MEETGPVVGADSHRMSEFAQSAQDAIKTFGADWRSRISSVPSQHAAILPSEMLAFCCVCAAQEVEVVIESGRRFGYSTEVLGRGPWDVVSIEHNPNEEFDERFKGHSRIKLVRGSGEHALPGLLDGRRTAVLLDGPKGALALKTLKGILPKVHLGAIHDVYRGSEIRSLLSHGDTTYWLSEGFSCDQDWDLDTDMMLHRGIRSHAELFTTGNVLGLFPGGLYG